MRSKILENRVLKIWFIVLFIVAGYVMYHHVTEEVYFQRYPGIFTGFIEMYLNERISLNYFEFAPLFSSIPQIDPSLSSSAQGVMMCESYFPNFIMLFLTLHYVTGLSPQLLVVLPIGVLFIPIAFFAMIKAYIPIKNGSNLIYYFLLEIFLMTYLATTKMYGSFYVAPAAFLLIIIIFLCVKRFYENGSNRFYYLIICMSTLSLAHYWHSALMIVLCFIISLWVFSAIFYLFNNKREIISKSTSLLISSLIISLTFTHLWHSSYIGDFFRTINLIDFILKTLIKLIGGNPFPVLYAFNYKDLLLGKGYFISTLLIYILSTLILFLSLIPHIFASNKIRKGNGFSLPLMFGLAIIFAQILNTFLYYKSNSINFFYIPIFFPIFGTYLLLFSAEGEKFSKIIISIFSLMIVLSLFSNLALNITDEAGATSVTKYKDTENSFEWIYNNMNRSKTIVIDFNIYGKYLQREVEKSKPSIEYECISSNSYGVLIGDIKIIEDLAKNYAIVDHATMSKGLPIHSYGSRARFEPKWIQIDNCQNQDKIYEDNYVSIFIFK